MNTTLYDTYLLLYFKQHNQMTSNHSNINVKKQNNGVSKITATHSIYLDITQLKTIIVHDAKRPMRLQKPLTSIQTISQRHI